MTPTWNLPQEVLQRSRSEYFAEATQEWDITGRAEDSQASSYCVCGKHGLRYLFEVTNRETGATLYPIGSTCIEQFEREDLTQEVAFTQSKFRILHAAQQGTLELRGGLFFRRLLAHLYEEGCFQPNKFNGFDAHKDYQFLVDMFNKRSEPSEKQQGKIWALLHRGIVPHLKSTML